jgi:hypothetical protein
MAGVKNVFYNEKLNQKHTIAGTRAKLFSTEIKKD